MRVTPRILRTVVVVIATCAFLGATELVGTTTAAAQANCGNTDAAPTLTVSPTTLSTSGVSATGVSTLSVTGSDYLVPPHACGANVFGGVYVFFGWVAPGPKWGPSWRGDGYSGQFGTSYSYPGDGGVETRDDGSGVVRLVSFTNGGASGAETPFHMDPGGNFSTTITVRGAVYSWTDSSTGAASTIDCTAVQCGVFTVGAHGKNSRTNERFTPIRFRTDAAAPNGTPGAVAPGGAGAAPSAAKPGTAGPNAANPGAATAGSRAKPTGSGSTAAAAAGSAPVSGTQTTGAATGVDAQADAAAGSVGAAGDAIAAAGDAIAAAGAEQAAGESRTERRIVAGTVVGVEQFDSSGGSGGLALLLVALAVTAAGLTSAGWLIGHFRRTSLVTADASAPTPPSTSPMAALSAPATIASVTQADAEGPATGGDR